MCDKNIINLLDIDFSTSNDQFDWLSNATKSIQTINGQLILAGESSTSRFVRSLGDIDAYNNRIRLQINLDVCRPDTSIHETFCAKFEVYKGSELIDVYSIYLEDISPGECLEFNFDRVYKYSELSGAVSLKITTIEGWSNEMKLDYLKCTNYKYCDDDVRNYFVIQDFLSDSLKSESSAFQLLEWKVDNIETLTPAFFSENNSPGGKPIDDWFFALANIDGTDRQANTTNPNTFNPFISELGLLFDDSNFYKGKAAGTTSGSDYGTGILNLGFEKPVVLNGNLLNQEGAFFVDIDFTKNLKIVFNILVNNGSDVFDSPEIFRQYTILFDHDSCERKFFYKDILNGEKVVDQKENGFLFGLTGTESSVETIGCDETFNFNGESGTFEFQIDFGTDIGMTGISYNAYSVPDIFEIEWNGKIFSSGYVGSNSRDQQLLNLGVSQSDINTGNPSTGIGNLLFNKDQATPTTAIIRVSAPFEGTAWQIKGICPDGGVPNQPPTVQIISQSDTFGQGDEQQFIITANDPDGTIVSTFIEWGDGGSFNSSNPPPESINHTFNSLGTKKIKITIADNDGGVATDEYIVNVIGSNSYQLTGSILVGCNNLGMNGTLEVNSGTVTVKNEFTDVQGNPTSAILTIGGNDLGANETVELGVGSYDFTSTTVNCSNGNGRNELVIL